MFCLLKEQGRSRGDALLQVLKAQGQFHLDANNGSLRMKLSICHLIRDRGSLLSIINTQEKLGSVLLGFFCFPSHYRSTMTADKLSCLLFT